MMFPDNLLSINQLSKEDILELFDSARTFLEEQKSNKVIFKELFLHLNLFFEPSTRTSLSFEIAAKRLGMQVISFSRLTSSLQKGETELDTLKVLCAMRPDSLALRARDPDLIEAAQNLCRERKITLINAGNGTNEHPTQALLDGFILWQHYGTLEGVILTICGDIKHSRVAHSNKLLLEKMGGHVRLVGPPFLLPEGSQPLTLQEGCKGSHAIMALRLQTERMSDADLKELEQSDILSYRVGFETIKLAEPQVLVMHPGPVQRDVEIESDVLDHYRFCKIFDQVEAGVAIRKAIFKKLLSKK